MIKKLEDLLQTSNLSKGKMCLSVVQANDEEVLAAVSDAKKMGFAEVILVGDPSEIKHLAEEHHIDISDMEIVEAHSLEESAEKGVRLVSSGQANVIMKGLIDTSIFLKAVLNKEWGLRTDSLLSHVMVYEVPSYHKLLALTDGGMLLYPTVEEKVKLIENAAKVMRSFGREEIKVACLAAKEKVNPKMPPTVDADELKKKFERGEFSKGIVVEGPMALDLAISKNSAKIKGYESPVAGDADILLVPSIEMGNGIGKSLTYFANAKSAGVVMGAKCPIVLTSRADDHETKLFSVALGGMAAAK